jgi:stage IV sporulation protein FB
MLRFRFFDFPVTIQWPFWVVMAVMGGATQARSPTQIHALLIWMAVVLASVLLHELGHALAMRMFGDGRVRIVLHAWGGYAQGTRWLGQREQIIIAAAGPAASLLIGVIGWMIATLLAPRHPLVVYALSSWLHVNFFWSLVNLLPVIPLDGGLISEALHGPEREARALKLSLGFASAVAVIGLFGYGQTFVGMFFGVLAWNNWQRLQGRDEIQWKQ